MYKWSTLLFNSKMQIITTIRYCLKKKKKKKDVASYTLGWLLSTKQKMVSVGEDMDKLESLYTVCGNVKWYNLYGKKVMEFPLKIKNRATILSSNSTSGYIVQKNYNQYL